MARELQPYEQIERSLIKKYRKQLWNPFIAAVKRYELVEEGTASPYASPAARTRCCWPS